MHSKLWVKWPIQTQNLTVQPLKISDKWLDLNPVL